MASPTLLTTPSPFSESKDASTMSVKTGRNKYFPRGRVSSRGSSIGNRELGSIASAILAEGTTNNTASKEKSAAQKKHHRRLQSNDLLLPPLTMSPNAMMPPLPSTAEARVRSNSGDKLSSMTSPPKKSLFPEPTSPTSVAEEMEPLHPLKSPPSADEMDLEIQPSVIPTSSGRRNVPKKQRHRRYVSDLGLPVGLPPKSPSPAAMRTHKRNTSMDGPGLSMLPPGGHNSLRSLPGPSTTPRRTHRKSQSLDVAGLQRLTQMTDKKITPSHHAASPADGRELQALSDEVRRLKTEAAGNHCPKLAAAWNRLGNYHFKARSHPLALECYHRALQAFGISMNNSSRSEISSSSDSSDDEKSTAETEFLCHTRTNMAIVYWTLGEHDIAVDMLQKSYEAIRELRGKDHVFTSNALHNLGEAHFLKGDLDAASRALKEALESRRLARGHNHVDVARTTSVLGSVELRRGNNKEAAKLFETALTMKRWLLGGNHSSVVITMLDLANARKACGQMEEAIRLYTEALRLQKVLWCSGATTSRDMGMTMHARGNLYATIGKTNEAIRSLKEAYLMYLEAGMHNDCTLVKCLKESLKAMDRVEEE